MIGSTSRKPGSLLERICNPENFFVERPSLFHHWVVAGYPAGWGVVATRFVLADASVTAGRVSTCKVSHCRYVRLSICCLIGSQSPQHHPDKQASQMAYSTHSRDVSIRTDSGGAGNNKETRMVSLSYAPSRSQSDSAPTT